VQNKSYKQDITNATLVKLAQVQLVYTFSKCVCVCVFILCVQKMENEDNREVVKLEAGVCS
jgi:hypothetical protein